MKDNELNQYIKEISFFLKKSTFIIPVLLVAFFGYGFVLTHHSINVDTLSAKRYFEEGTLIGQGRLTATIIHKIFSIMEFNPFFVDGIAVVFLILSALILCSLFKKITNNTFNILSYTIFSCLFLSYPLINEIFVYTPAGLSIALGFFMTSISLLLMYECITVPKINYIFFATLLIFFATSLYESFLPVYLVGCFIILILNTITTCKKEKILDVIKKICILILPALIGLILALMLPKIVMLTFNIKEDINAQKNILYKSLGFIEGIKNLNRTILESYFINGMLYLPIGVFVISNVIAVFMGLFLSIKNKNVSILLLYIGLILSNVSLSVLQGEATGYRTCQTFYIFTAFIIMLFYQFIISSKVKQFLKTIITFIVGVLIFYQVKTLHSTFYLNYVRYEEEKNTLIKVCSEIELNYDINKPVAFIGEYKFSNYLTSRIYVDKDDFRMKIARNILSLFNIDNTKYNTDYKYIQTNINPYLEWGQNAFQEGNVEIFKWIDMLGFKLKSVDKNTLFDAYDYIKNRGDLTKAETQVIETEKYIVVNI